MNRPDYRNYCLRDLLTVKNFQALSPEERDFKVNSWSVTVEDLDIIGRFGLTLEQTHFDPVTGREQYKVIEEPWYLPITESVAELQALDLPTESVDGNGCFRLPEDKWREGKFDLGHSGYEMFPTNY